MCDSLIALKSDTADGVAVFAKNSDRPTNEGQFLKFFPAANHPENSTVKCTYIEIPQAQHTNAVLLSKPYWIWGAEMGVNDKSVVIGNEAVFPKVPNATHTKLRMSSLPCWKNLVKAAVAQPIANPITAVF